MTRHFKSFVFAAVLASAALSSVAANAATDCQANFVGDDDRVTLQNLFATKSATYKSHALIRGVSANDAFTRAYREILHEGIWTISSTDREAGSIIATATGNGGENHVVLNFLIDPSPGALNISVTITASAGGMGHPNQHVCGPIEAAAGNS